MLEAIKRLSQYSIVISLGPILSIPQKIYMLNEPCYLLDYILAFIAIAWLIFIWYFYRKEKRNCQVVIKRKIDNKYVVVISKSKFGDMIVKIVNGKFPWLKKEIYNPQYSTEEKNKVKWKRKFKLKFIIVEDKRDYMDLISVNLNYKFTFEDRKFYFIYSL